MTQGFCPECGQRPEAHDGWGGPLGCTLTDHGVAERIHQYRQDVDPASLTVGERAGLTSLVGRGPGAVIHTKVANSLVAKGLATRNLHYDLEITEDGRTVHRAAREG